MPPDDALRRQLSDFASRLEIHDKRIERLETLEFGTAAFPSGGFTPICDVKLTVPAAFIDLCPAFSIPQTFRHLLIIHSLGEDTFGATSKIAMNFNADFAANYYYYTRQERFGVPPVGSADTEATAIAATDTKFLVGQPSAQELVFGVAPFPQFNAGMILIPDYTQEENRKPAAWWGWGRSTAFVEINGVLDQTFVVYQGGGYWNKTPIVPITSIRLTSVAIGAFRVDSRATLYGM